ncbi:hypothetical protein HHK36_016515 [Tetracentron sinense]|uniref:Uncharacterized protein n=1 Tax=Tetracentron sinense TaxID=13715 RepID=A0A834YZP9_TETSI|nr:hypothetical protein HHK36_016515 [Tetracentron sinense]
MKTISGRLVSSKPISLSKAASVLSTFVSAETGASQAVSAYLKRASASFNELVQFHRELKTGRSKRKHQKTRVEAVDNENLMDARKNPREDRGRILEEQSYGYHGISEGGNVDDVGRNIGTKKKRKNSDFNDRRAKIEEREEKSKGRKKRTHTESKDEVTRSEAMGMEVPLDEEPEVQGGGQPSSSTGPSPVLPEVSMFSSCGTLKYVFVNDCYQKSLQEHEPSLK